MYAAAFRDYSRCMETHMQGRLKAQGSIFQACVFLPKRLRDELLGSWAEVVRSEVIPSIPESEFSHLYAHKKGRPGIPVSVFVVLSFLKEFFKLTDSQLLEAFHFNLTFLHAFGLAPGELTMAERSLYYLRERIIGDPAVAKTFEIVSETFRQKAGIVCDVQRLDSTHICSNMANLNRLQLFVRTIESFLFKLRKAFPQRLSRVPEALRERYLDRSGYFGDTTGEKSQRRLTLAARDLAALIDLFHDDAEVKAMKAYSLLVRLFQEQCQRVPAAEQPAPTVASPEVVAPLAPVPTPPLRLRPSKKSRPLRRKL
jgi:hypothetical protein